MNSYLFKSSKLAIFVFALVAGLISLPEVASADASETCALEVPCEIDGRSYHARVPDGWDGKSSLPVLMHFHGWGRQGPLIMKHSRIAGATRKMGVLLLAPNGRGRSWQFWSKDTQDVAFADSVLKDAAKRWPIDQSKIFVSGYSYGSAMAWRFACESGGKINTLLAVSGTLPSQEEKCASPVNVRHVHGTKDTVMDMPIGNNNDVTYAVKLWRERNLCKDTQPQKANWQAVKILSFSRHTWSKCESGKNVILDVHKRGHFIPRFWIERQLQQLL